MVHKTTALPLSYGRNTWLRLEEGDLIGFLPNQAMPLVHVSKWSPEMELNHRLTIIGRVLYR